MSNLGKCPNARNACFELYGFDVLIDKKLKPWVLEVNVLPSLSSSSPFDKKIKTVLVCDLLTLIGIRGYDKQKVHSSPNTVAKEEERLPIADIRALTGTEELSESEMATLLDHEEEFARKGSFSRIFPLAANVDYYERFFECKRYKN